MIFTSNAETCWRKKPQFCVIPIKLKIEVGMRVVLVGLAKSGFLGSAAHENSD